MKNKLLVLIALCVLAFTAGSAWAQESFQRYPGCDRLTLTPVDPERDPNACGEVLQRKLRVQGRIIPSDGSPPMSINTEVTGTLVIRRSPPYQLTDGTGRYQIDTEILSMDLVDETGSIRVTNDPDRQLRGSITQRQRGRDFPADSFFDVYAQLDLGGDIYTTVEPAGKAKGVINSIPPLQDNYTEDFFTMASMSGSAQLLALCAPFVGF